MTRWKNDTKEFNVSLASHKNKDGSYSRVCHIPKPVAESLGNPKMLSFKLEKDKVVVTAGSKESEKPAKIKVKKS